MKEILVKEGIFEQNTNPVVLVGSRCKNCGRVFFPKVKLCLSCSKDMMGDISLSRKGKLFSYTVVNMASSHFSPPYAVGYVEMPEGLRIFTPLEMNCEKPFRVGMEMVVSREILWIEEGKNIIGFRFKPL